MRDHFVKRLCELAAQNPRIMLVTGDLGFSVLDEFRHRFPDQFVNAGVAEQNMIGLATGLALEGRIVFTYSIANFGTLRCLEQIRNDACYHEANVKIVSVGGGFSYGALGISHHATEDLAIMRSLPNMTVLSPCGLWEAEEVTDAIAAIEGTCYLRLDKSAGDDSPRSSEAFRIGHARLLREGKHCTIIVTGGILGEVWRAVQMLGERDIDAGVLAVHSIKPFDRAAVVRACTETNAIVCVEEHTVHGGLGSLVAETLMIDRCFPSFFLQIGLDQGFSSIIGSQSYLRSRYGLDASSIARRTEELLNGRA